MRYQTFLVTKILEQLSEILGGRSLIDSVHE